MLLKEAQKHLSADITFKQLEQINFMYYLLDFPKNDFFKVINSIGLNKWLAKREYWQHVERIVSEYEPK
jgi:hypothetical protein